MVVARPGIANIDHFVVLMLENRSFDHLFGYLDLPGIDNLLHGGPYEADGRNGGPPVPVLQSTGAASDYITPVDPPHEFSDVLRQILTNPPMRGFVQSYGGAPQDVMRCFRPQDVPVFTALARNYVVCDRWFCSLPSSTWPNRYFVHAATSMGYVDIGAMDAARLLGGHKFTAPTVFGRITAGGRDWRVYHHNPPHVSTLTELAQTWGPLDQTHWREYDPGNGLPGFVEDAAKGDLPFYTFIEPEFDMYMPRNRAVPDNSGHPPGDFRLAEELVATTYNALRQSPLWPSTALIVTFDEHGGFYDHVTPPPIEADNSYAHHPASTNFQFNRLGPRVPALIISPWVKKGFVDHGPGTTNGPKDGVFYDHTSIVATIIRSIGRAPLTERDRRALDLHHLFENPERPDGDCPEKVG
jgi:phospholipase C